MAQKILIKGMVPHSRLPQKSNSEAACYDVYANWIKQERDLITIGLGFCTQLPYRVKGVIVPRSSLTKLRVIMQNSPAQIDSDYRGEWMIKFRIINRSLKEIFFGRYFNPFTVGDRVAQIYFEEETNVVFEATKDLMETRRGSGGFGSTGN